MFWVKKRLSVQPIWLVIAVALYLNILFNRSFWQRAMEYFHNDYGQLALIFIIISCLFTALTASLSLNFIIKPWVILLIFASSVAGWFTDQFGTIIDRHMIVNVMETTTSEARHLLTVHFILYLTFTALLPSLIIVWLRLEGRSIFSRIWRNGVTILLCLTVACGLSVVISRTLMSTLREHNDLIRILNPVAPMTSVVKYIIREHLEAKPEFQTIGLDAKISHLSGNKTRPRVIIMVIGEAARAENFAFQGYERQTNPQLAKRNILYFGNVSSCGTSTAQSVPCMFSHLTKDEFDRRKALFMSSLPDILAQAGIKVEWWENNSDSKGVANRIRQVIFYGRDDSQFCLGGECLDGIMLDPLDEWLDKVTGDAVLFVHQMGSHGPAYFKRYTNKFRQFSPDCRGVEFSQCSIEEVRNAYDNSLLYTDDFLSQIIDKLASRSSTIESGLIYMSDHGQSLGENGLYLHGMPYALAPSQQTHIPFLTWLSPELTQSLNLDSACLAEGRMVRSLSHDHLFSSLLGIMEVATNLKQTEFDIFTPCRDVHSDRQEG